MISSNKVSQSFRCSRHSVRASLKIIAVAGAAILIALAGINAQAAPINFDINFTDEAEWTAQSKSALQYAADIWGGLLSANYPGETITIDADFAVPQQSGGLAYGHPTRAIPGESLPISDAEYFFFPAATANHLALKDLYAGESEITIAFSPDSEHPAAAWWYDTDNAPPPPPHMPAHYDFVTIALHEIAHGLGLLSGLMETTPGILQYPFTLPFDGPCPGCETGWYYDRYVFNTRYISDDPGVRAEGFPISVAPEGRLALVTDPFNLVFDGWNAVWANGGVNSPVLYSPPDYVQGSSVSHLSENPDHGYPGDLMIPHAPLSLSNHNPSAIDLAMLKDVGWVSIGISEIPEPSSLLLLMTGTSMLFFAAYRRKRK